MPPIPGKYYKREKTKSSKPLTYFISQPYVVKVMREIRHQSDTYLERGRKLTPNGTDIPVGGAHIDEYARGEGLSKLLVSLGKGKTLDEALEDAKSESTLWFDNWNKRHKGEYQVQRWLQSADDILETAHRKIRAAIRGVLREIVKAPR